MYRQLIFFAFLFSFGPLLLAQEKWLIELEEVGITEKPLIDVFSVDSIVKKSWLGNFSPFYHSTLNFREYSPGGISIFSIRGSTAQQNSVFWNGFKIENHMLGLTDINLFPIEIFDQILIRNSSETTQLINGKPGGVIQFNSLNEGNYPPLSLSAFVDDNNNQSYHVKTHVKKGKTIFGLRALFNRYQNQYSYKDAGGNKNIADHAGLNQNALLFSISHKNDNNWRINYDLWLQQTDRKIPPTIFQQHSRATQSDKHLRTSVVGRKNFNNGILEVRTALLAEQLIYEDSLIQEYSDSKIIEWQTRMSYSTSVANFFPLKIESGFRSIQIRTDAYEIEPSQNSFFVSLSSNSGDRFSIAQVGMQLKQEFNREHQIPLIFQLQLSGDFHPGIRWSLTGGNHYRIPTFNDLYWPGAGNKALLPERGSQVDASIQFKENHPLLHKIELTGFYRKTNNLIFWNNRQGSWRPENLSTVKARGFEFRWHTEWMVSEVKVLSKLGYDFVLSELTKERFPNDAAINKQLPYIPKHSFILENVFQYRGWQLSSHLRSLSTRYTNTDHSSSLEPNHLLDVSISKTLDLNILRCNLSLSVYNATNKSHFSVANRPLPLRSFGLGVQIFIH